MRVWSRDLLPPGPALGPRPWKDHPMPDHQPDPYLCTCHGTHHVVPSLARDCEKRTAKETTT